MNGTYVIRYEGSEVGALKINTEGLMTVFTAETKPLAGVLRLAVVSGGTVVPIGVLTPSQRGLTIKRSFTKNMLAELSILSIDGVVLISQDKAPAAAWKPVSEPSALFTDSELKAASRGSRGVMTMQEGEVIRAAFPIRSDMSFALMPAFCLGRPLKVNGDDYLVFDIKDGNIVL